MSYERNREGEYGGEGGNRQSHHEGRHHGHRDGNEGERYNRNDEYSSNQSRRDDGNASTGGYGREAERPTHEYSAGRDGEETGGYNEDARRNLQSQGFEQRRNEYEGQGQGRGSDGSGDYDQSNHRRHNQDSGEYGGGGRSVIGSGETYVGLDSTGDNERRTTDAYGGESANYPSNNQGGYGSMGSDQKPGTTKSTGTYVAGSGEKWKPGQEMHFPAAEAESEKNPYAPVAQQMAGETHDVLKDGVKILESWAETKAKELMGSGK